MAHKTLGWRKERASCFNGLRSSKEEQKKALHAFATATGDDVFVSLSTELALRFAAIYLRCEAGIGGEEVSSYGSVATDSTYIARKNLDTKDDCKQLTLYSVITS